MPGYDRTGPVGAGTRTGRNRGRCGRPAAKATAVADPYHDCGLGWGYWPRGGGRGRRSGGRGGSRGQDSAGPDTTLSERRAFLGRRMKALTEELDRVKTLLLEYSRGDAQDEE
jgi:hypothetical protein